ncbi:NACHT domain-containing protein [Trichocoleus sp. FACHB-90]|uniref:NB-ARC domain-containing protein n=1 Tax=Cyanophyceae TaxID=3028117 RepID=UPI00168A1CDD|nr:NB-ARC domain-containing protein [Trichocoleus sp. FACHB-90]MBD1928287.1 NACHT domain-containing protein [Trichocoleus sp. FACHB-90]
MESTVNEQEADFQEAANNWNLEKLYIDLASAKGRSLTPVEKKFLRGLLCGYSPAEIADTVYKSRTSSAVRVYLSNGLYKYIQELLIRQTGDTIKIKNWSRVTNLLSKAGYKTESVNLPEQNQSETEETLQSTVVADQHQDWEEVIDVEDFYGSQEELATLEQWIVNDSCRLVALLGMGGIGKTALAVKLAEQISENFEFVIWRSLRHAPPIQDLVASLIQFLSQGQETVDSASAEERISRLMTYIRSRRCLLILDQAEAVLCSGKNAGYYSYEYQVYGELFRRLGEERHPSCCILTSREKPKEIAALEGANLPVRCLELRGLAVSNAQELLQLKGLIGDPEECRVLINRYSGNPLILKIVATTIKDIFNGNITDFLLKEIVVFGDIGDLLDRHFERLSNIEKKVMYWLAIRHKSVSVGALQEEIAPGISKREQMEAIESLRRRSLLEKNLTNFTLVPVVRAYLAEKLVE